MKVVCYATSENQYLDALRDSCKKFDYDLSVLGLGKKWGGMGDKIVGVKEHLEDAYDNDLYLVVDAYDVIFTRESKKFEEDFYKNYKEDDIVFNSEVLPNSYVKYNDWVKFYSSEHPNSKNKYKAMNAGVVVGRRTRLIEFYEKLIDRSTISTQRKQSDQQTIYRLFNKGIFPDIKLDYECKLFTVITEFNNDIVFKDSRLYNKYTKTYPYLIHGAGKKTSLNKYIDFLNLKTSFYKSHIVYNFYYYFFRYLDYLIFLGAILISFLFYKGHQLFKTRKQVSLR